MNHYLLILLSFSFLTGTAQNNDWEWGGPLDPSQAAYDVRHITLNLDADPDHKTINGFAAIKMEILSPIDHIKLDLIDQYQIDSVLVNGRKMEFERGKDIVEVKLDSEAETGARLEVVIHYGGETPEAVNPPWQGGFTYARDENGLHWVGLSSQNEGGKIFMPSKDHPSDQPQEGADLVISVPDPYKVAGNGLLISETKDAGNAIFHWRTTYSINNYGINWTIGDFVSKTRNYTTIAGNDVPMVIYLLRQNEARLPELMDILETSLETQEQYFGEYPFQKEKVGIVETPYLGMEHQTINAYGNKFRYSKVGNTIYDTLLYHELGHEWWGNKVGVRDWADFWIQEGFCAYGDWLFIEARGGYEAYLEHVARARGQIQNTQPVIVKENATSDEAYHGDIYTKGAFVLHSLRYILGDEVFFRTIKGFANEPAFTYENLVKTEDLESYISGTTHFDSKPFFDFFLRTVQVPEIHVELLGEETYSIKIVNIDFTLLMDVQLDGNTERMELSSRPVLVRSSETPVIDRNGWFLKKVIHQKE